jgi:hypothetical protein
MRRIHRQVERCLALFFYLHSEAMHHVSAEDGDAGRANNTKLFPLGIPDNSDIVDLALLIQTSAGDGRSWREIAREFTCETKDKQNKALSLLSQLRYLCNHGRCALKREQ